MGSRRRKMYLLVVLTVGTNHLAANDAVTDWTTRWQKQTERKKLAGVSAEVPLTHLPCLFYSISCLLNTLSVPLTGFMLQRIQEMMSALYIIAEHGEQTSLVFDA